MRYTIWSSARKYEWIIWAECGEEIVRRSGMIHTSYSAAKRAMLKALKEIEHG